MTKSAVSDVCVKVALAIVAVSALLVSLQSRWTLRTRSILIVDGGGRERIALGMINDPTGKEVPAIKIFDKDHKPRVGVMMMHDDTPWIELTDASADCGVMLNVAEDKWPALSMVGERGSRASLGVGSAGVVELRLVEEREKAGVHLTLLPGNLCEAAFFDSQDKVRAAFGLRHALAQPLLRFMDADGVVVWQAPPAAK